MLVSIMSLKGSCTNIILAFGEILGKPFKFVYCYCIQLNMRNWLEPKERIFSSSDTNSARVTRTHKDSASDSSSRHHVPTPAPVIQPLDSIVITPADAWPSLHSNSSSVPAAPPPILPGSAKTYASAHNGGMSASVPVNNNSGFVLNTKKGRKNTTSATNSVSSLQSLASASTVLTNGPSSRQAATREQKR